ncbi:helix-turn-helix domain-containing protein [Rubrivirga sp. IMCC43871]|uniref:helix-turn-helix domain-containing protein n=1 Tax=Rubrivirga sp. IMCC43871 TaxID=3391575 RepID=UPI00398FFF66
MPSGPFESDLRAVREAKGLSLGDIQQQTRIPVDVLRRFETGDLVGDPTYNEVYLQAFLKSYAKAVGVSPSAVTAAYGAVKSGSYRGELHPDGSSGAPPLADAEPESTASVPASPPTASAPKKAATDRKAPAPAAPSPRATGTAPAVDALRNTPDPAARPVTPEKPKTLAQARVNRPAVPGARRSFDKNWGLILGLFAVFVFIVGGAMWWLLRDDSPDAEPDDQVVAVGADELDATPDSVGASAETPTGPQLALPITVTVTAGGDGLQWFRVTDDTADRAPYWVDQGGTQTFTADSLLILWGEGNEGGPAYAFEETTVEVQGLRFTPQSGKTLTISRATGQALLDSLAAAGGG